MSIPTMSDVAKRAGVSKTTVSHVLNETRFVEEETVSRVRQAMRELGYRPNQLARSLRRQETKTIALITPDNANIYWAEFARVVEGAGFAAGYTVLLCNVEWSAERERKYVETLLERQIDGIILTSAASKLAVLTEIVAANVPVVLVGMHSPLATVSTVRVDDFQGGYLAGEYLVRLGHQRIGCISTAKEYHVQARATGFLQALGAAGIDTTSVAFAEGDFSYASGAAAVPPLLAQQPDLTAIFAVNDNMALGAYKGLHNLQRRIPTDVSVIGYDNIIYGTTVTPELTTVAQPIIPLGEKVFELLLKQIDDPSANAETIIIPPTLIERESCRALQPTCANY